MYAVSTAFRNALVAGNPQRIFIYFLEGSSAGTIMTNEHIAIDAGVTFHESWCDDSDVTLGNTSSSEINFVLFNDEGEWDDFEFGKFKVYIGVEISTTTSEVVNLECSVDETNLIGTADINRIEYTYALMPMGVFVGTRPNIVSKDEITVSSNDLMTLFDVDMPSQSELGLSGVTLTATRILQAMCSHVGVALQSTTFLNSSVTLSEWPESFESSTMKDVIGWIAELACANALINRDGKLELRWIQTTTASYDENDYLEHTPFWYNTPPVDAVYVRDTLEDGETHTGSGSNAYLIQDNPFLGVSS